jgi:DNA processing protein
MIQLGPRDARYPKRLRALTDPPDPLWVWGALPDDQVPTVGIVGTRRLTTYGARVARELALVLARAGAVVVSGLAQGIDSTAHAGALEGGGHTIAVLGEGLAWFDDHGPIRRRTLARRIREQGALVSEYPLDVPGSDWSYPKRNATIAGLCDALVVVEAPERSGALITAKRMLKLRRQVYAVPGPFGAPTWIGSNEFIAVGKAKLLASAQQIADQLGLRLATPARSDRGDDLAGRLMALLAVDAAETDAIAAGLRVTSAEAATLIAQQLVAGAIVPTPDGRFARR